jgi:hypothetical protein
MVEITDRDAAMLSLFKKYLKASQSAYNTTEFLNYLRSPQKGNLTFRTATVTPTQEEYEAVCYYDRRVYLGED